MNLKIAVLAGDGIGPEVILQAKKALYAVGVAYEHDFIFEEALIGAVAIDKTGSPLPEQTLNLCLNTDAVLLGTIGDPKYDADAKVHPRQGLLRLKKEFGLYTKINPFKIFKGLLAISPFKKETIEAVDLVIYRELVDEVSFEEEITDESETITSDSESKITKIAHLAFKSAQNRRKKVTLVDKARVLETSRLWRKVVQNVSKDYPDVSLEFSFADTAAKQIILNPKQFDVILTGSLFGKILSDEASAFSGSVGLLASASLGEKNALFGPSHGSFPQAKGKNIANPIASILSAAMLLEHFGLKEEAKKIYEGIEKAIEFNVVTTDINPDTKFGTNEVGEFVSNYILNKEDLMYFNNDNVHLGQSTIV